jgi:hypothetical protein
MSSLFYKYRAIEPWEYLLDIFVNERLYAAKFESLNDPMEGMFTYSKDQESPGFIKQIVEEKARLGIVSLSRTHNNTVMWSYYAAAHKGVVLGIEIDVKQKNVVDVSKVRYAKNISFRGFYGSEAETEARKILSKKLSAWKHEDEVRVFSRSQFVPVYLRQLFLGCQMPKAQQQLLKRMLRSINPELEVKSMKRTDLDTQGLPGGI